MNRLAIDRFPVCGAFIVAEGIEERFAEGGIGGEAVGLVVWGWGGGGVLFVAFGAVGAVMVGSFAMAVTMGIGVWVTAGRARFGGGFEAKFCLARAGVIVAVWIVMGLGVRIGGCGWRGLSCLCVIHLDGTGGCCLCV